MGLAIHFITRYFTKQKHHQSVSFTQSSDLWLTINMTHDHWSTSTTGQASDLHVVCLQTIAHGANSY